VTKPEEKPCTLAFYMKSGNVVRAYHVKSWTFHYKSNTITSLEVNREEDAPDDTGLILTSIALDQIEAIAKEAP
jgi:hypothetical protein